MTRSAHQFVGWLDGWSVGLLVCQSVIISLKTVKLQFHATTGKHQAFGTGARIGERSEPEPEQIPHVRTQKYKL